MAQKTKNGYLKLLYVFKKFSTRPLKKKNSRIWEKKFEKKPLPFGILWTDSLFSAPISMYDTRH